MKSQDIESHPVVGRLKADRTSLFFCSGFQQFRAHAGVDGLAKVDGRKLEILAVFARIQGRGSFRTFVTQAKTEYDIIRFWALMNPQLEATLGRYGFVSGHDLDQFGELVDVMDWTR